jgi:hypothetical protein
VPDSAAGRPCWPRQWPFAGRKDVSRSETGTWRHAPASTRAHILLQAFPLRTGPRLAPCPAHASSQRVSVFAQALVMRPQLATVQLGVKSYVHYGVREAWWSGVSYAGNATPSHMTLTHDMLRFARSPSVSINLSDTTSFATPPLSPPPPAPSSTHHCGSSPPPAAAARRRRPGRFTVVLLSAQTPTHNGGAQPAWAAQQGGCGCEAGRDASHACAAVAAAGAATTTS